MGIHRRLMCITVLGTALLCLAESGIASEDPAAAQAEPEEQEPKGQEEPGEEEPKRQEPEEKEQEPGEREQQEEPPDARPLWPTLSVISPDLETVFPTRTSRDYILSPSTVSVLRRAEIRGSAARYPSDVLRLVPGLEVQRIFSTSSNVGVRSFNEGPTASQGVFALIDGRQVTSESLGNPLWDQLMLIPEDIEEIEVIRGPGSFLYGPNAMHGLVNFITKSPLDYTDSEASVLGAIGSVDSTLARLSYVRRDKESGSGLLARFVYDDIDRFETPPEEDTRDKVYGEIRFEKDLGGGSRGDSPKSDHLLELGAGISDQEFDLLLPTLDLLPGLPPLPSSRYVTQLQETYITAKYTRGDLVARADWTASDFSARAPLFYAPFDLDVDVLEFNIHYSFGLLQDHEVTVGGGYRYSTFVADPSAITVGRHSTNLFSGFIQDEITLVPDKLFLTAGLRLDEHSEAGLNVAPRAALVWRFKESHSLRFSYGTGHRNPSLRENWLALPVTTPVGVATVVGNEDLEAEELQSFELGYRGWFYEDKLRVGVTGYLNYFDDLAELRGVAPATLAWVNVDEQRAHGIEVEGEYGFSESLSAFGNYSYGVLEDRATGERIASGPLHKANLGLRYSAPLDGPRGSSVDAMLWLTYFDDTDLPPSGTTDEYVLLSLGVSFEFSKGRAYVKAFNLLDNEHKENVDGDEYGRILQVGFEYTW